MKDIVYTSATELVDKIKSQELTVVDVVTAFLKEIKKHNPSINAIFELEQNIQWPIEKQDLISKTKPIKTIYDRYMRHRTHFKGLFNTLQIQ